MIRSFAYFKALCGAPTRSEIELFVLNRTQGANWDSDFRSLYHLYRQDEGTVPNRLVIARCLQFGHLDNREERQAIGKI